MEREDDRALAAVLEAACPVAMRSPRVANLVGWQGLDDLLGGIRDDDVRLLAESLEVLSGEEYDGLRASLVDVGRVMEEHISSKEGREAILTWMKEKGVASLLKASGMALVEQWLEGASKGDLNSLACMLVREVVLSVRQVPPVEDAASWARDVAERDDAQPERWSAALGSRVALLASTLPLSGYWSRVLARYGAGSVVAVRWADEDDAGMERLLKALEMIGILEPEKTDSGGGYGNDESNT